MSTSQLHSSYHQCLPTFKLIIPHHIQQVVISPLLLFIILLMQYTARRLQLFSICERVEEVMHFNGGKLKKYIAKPERGKASLLVFTTDFIHEMIGA